MEALWITLRICLPIIGAGTALYLFRHQLPALRQRALRQKFFPDPVTDAHTALGALYVACGSFVAYVVAHSDAFVFFIFYSGSVMLGTLFLVIVRTPFRCFYTLAFTLTAYLGLFFRIAALKASLNADAIIWMSMCFLYFVIFPGAITWIVTLFRQDKHS